MCEGRVDPQGFVKGTVADKQTQLQGCSANRSMKSKTNFRFRFRMLKYAKKTILRICSHDYLMWPKFWGLSMIFLLAQSRVQDGLQVPHGCVRTGSMPFLLFDSPEGSFPL